MWSVAECLTHLNSTNRIDIEPLRHAIESGRKRGITGSPPFRYGWLSRKFIQVLEPPVKKKVQSPKIYLPPPEAELAPTMAAYEQLIRTYTELWRSSAGLDLSRVKTILPALPPRLQPILKMPLGARFETLAAHDRRHLWQAEQVRSRLSEHIL